MGLALVKAREVIGNIMRVGVHSADEDFWLIRAGLKRESYLCERLVPHFNRPVTAAADKNIRMERIPLGAAKAEVVKVRVSMVSPKM